MMIFMTAMALAAAAPGVQAAPAADAHAQHMHMGQMDHSKMDHSKMDHAQMGQHDDDCCKKTADGKMECCKPDKGETASDHSGH